MTPYYFVTDVSSGTQLPAEIIPATKDDFAQTKQDWQTDWNSDFIQRPELEKYALKTSETHELVGLTILSNCDHLLYLGGQELATARYISVKANKSVHTILNMPLNHA